ncbi:MAG: hypothetical protein ACRDQD_01030 [Nocardioidaceae bacterium]
MRLTLAALAVGGTALVGLPTGAIADSPATPNCLGVVTAQRAQAHHDIGQHASAQEEPRLGLGNVAREVLGDGAHVGDLGAFLGEIDGDDATHCP